MQKTYVIATHQGELANGAEDPQRVLFDVHSRGHDTGVLTATENPDATRIEDQPRACCVTVPYVFRFKETEKTAKS